MKTLDMMSGTDIMIEDICNKCTENNPWFKFVRTDYRGLIEYFRIYNTEGKLIAPDVFLKQFAKMLKQTNYKTNKYEHDSLWCLYSSHDMEFLIENKEV